LGSDTQNYEEARDIDFYDPKWLLFLDKVSTNFDGGVHDTNYLFAKCFDDTVWIHIFSEDDIDGLHQCTLQFKSLEVTVKLDHITRDFFTLLTDDDITLQRLTPRFLFLLKRIS
jgi:hypothetical protein